MNTSPIWIRYAAFTLIAAAALVSFAIAQDAPTSQPAVTSAPSEADDEMNPPREPSPSEILKALMKDNDAPPRPLVLPSQPGQTVRNKQVDPSVLPANAVAPITPRLYPDGYRIVDRPGRLSREGDYYVFSFESRGEGPAELPMRLLPNRLLEDMEIATAGSSTPIVFLVSGELTEYHGVNYLLVQKLLTRPEMGNLK